jgi:hypothetical protein
MATKKMMRLRDYQLEYKMGSQLDLREEGLLVTP